MMSLSFAAVLQASVLLTGVDSYADAHKAVAETGRPLVVIVGADWCPACQVMEKTVIPQVRQRGLLGRVAFAAVNLDQERELGQQLTAGGPIPQLLMYRKTAAGWRLRRLVGGQSVETVESFIQEGVVLDEESKRAEASRPVRPAAHTSAASPTESARQQGESRG